MILEILSYAGTGVASVPAFGFGHRVFQVRSAVRRGIGRHLFEPSIRRDMHGPHVMKWCKTCQQGPKAWIHTNRQSSDAAEGNHLDPLKIKELERAEIQWRFSNDPEWVEVFGPEYDPDTFDLIPKFHNGECGGPNDSCERCAWEADRKRKQEDEKRRARNRKALQEQKAAERVVEKRRTADIARYTKRLWMLWNTVRNFETARDEFEDLMDEIGMLTDDAVRRDVKGSDIAQRLRYCLGDPKSWSRREEVWQDKQQQDRERRRYDSDYY